MRARWPILATFVVLGAGYIGYPYATLYRLGVAVRHSDHATLRTLVDWYSVREGLKEDICDMVLEGPVDARPTEARADNKLPPFGASFVRGMTGNALDQSVTPETLSSMTRGGAVARGGDPRVIWAFFDNPTEFSVSLLTDGAADPIQMVMAFRGMRWKVVRVSLPEELLERAGSGNMRGAGAEDSLMAASRQ